MKKGKKTKYGDSYYVGTSKRSVAYLYDDHLTEPLKEGKKDVYTAKVVFARNDKDANKSIERAMKETYLEKESTFVNSKVSIHFDLIPKPVRSFNKEDKTVYLGCRSYKKPVIIGLKDGEKIPDGTKVRVCYLLDPYFSNGHYGFMPYITQINLYNPKTNRLIKR